MSDRARRCMWECCECRYHCTIRAWKKTPPESCLYWTSLQETKHPNWQKIGKYAKEEY